MRPFQLFSRPHKMRLMQKLDELGHHCHIIARLLCGIDI